MQARPRAWEEALGSPCYPWPRAAPDILGQEGLAALLPHEKELISTQFWKDH